MLDPNLIREKPDFVKEGIKKKNVDASLVDEFLKVDSERKKLIKILDDLRHERKVISDEIGTKIARGENVDDKKTKVREIGSQIAEKENMINDVNKRSTDILLEIPNLPYEKVSYGKDESENTVLRQEGIKKVFSFTPKPHWEIAENLDVIDFKRAVKISGARFYILKGMGAKLERAIISWMIDLHIQKHGYTELLPPYLVNRNSMIGTGQLPKFEEDMYKIEGEELYLVPTAEVPVTNYYSGEILDESDLPIKYVAFTACFRKEAGAAGKDTRGIIRVHQFNKVEMVRFVKAEDSYNQFYELLDNAEDVLRELELPYQIKAMCTGDLGFAATLKYDPEVYMPAQDKYVEISSVSNFEGYQARRANIRYRTKGGDIKYVHTINGSGLAVGRTMAAILENYQQEDGSVLLPKVLQKYVGTDKIAKQN
jgi:seryl-tRNA synthetase